MEGMCVGKRRCEMHIAVYYDVGGGGAVAAWGAFQPSCARDGGGTDSAVCVGV